MPLCYPCLSFGSWLLSKTTEDAIRFYQNLKPGELYVIYNPEKDQRLAFPHHRNEVSLLAARDAGCPLCTLIVTFRSAQVTTRFTPKNTGVSQAMFFQVDPSRHAKLYYGSSGHINSYVALDVYSISSGSDIWPIKSHRNSHPLCDSLKATMRRWIKDCLVRHKACNSRNEYRPTRVLDVSPKDDSCELRLIETGDLLTKISQQGDSAVVFLEYATLSHCWGNTSHFTTSVATLQQRKTCISESDLNRTFKDAIAVTRAIGLQYLWIDSLCIIQDSVDDWEQESAKMCDVYGSATVNIVATSAKDGDEGFLHERPTINLCHVRPTDTTTPMSCLMGDFWIQASSDYEQSLEGSKLSSRAWCFQENILTPRVLSFERSNVSFSCRVHSCHEERPSDTRTTRASAIGFSKSVSQSITTQEQQRRAFKQWRSMVSEYSQKELTFQKDKFPALAGLASQFGETCGGRYLAGLWERDLPWGLCWSPKQGGLPPISRKVEPYRAPSWSWASQLESVSYGYDYISSDIGWDVKILDCSIDPVAGPYGQVRGGWLTLEARLLEAKLSHYRDGNDEPRRRRFGVDWHKSLGNNSYPSNGHLFMPDDFDKAWDISQVWYCFLGGDEVLVLRRLDSHDVHGRAGSVYERVGYFHASHTPPGTWDGVPRQEIKII